MKTLFTCSYGLILVLAALGLGACTNTPDKAEAPAVKSTSAPASLMHRYSFSDGAKDSVGKIDGVLKGGAKLAGGKLVLDNASKGSGDESLSYLEFGASPLPKSGSVSIAFWFTATDAASFARVLDFGDREDVQGRAFIYFTPRNAEDMARAAITATNTADKSYIDLPKLDDGKAHAVVLVIDGTAGKMHVFVDGKEPAAAADLGPNTLDKVRPTHNWLGRSGFDQDGGLTAAIDELRIYSAALTLADAETLAKAGPDTVPPVPAAK